MGKSRLLPHIKGDPKDGVVVILTQGQASISLWLEDHRDVLTEEFYRWYQSATMMLYRVSDGNNESQIIRLNEP